jgi:hypothetical protein
MKKWKVSFEIASGYWITAIIEASSPILAADMAHRGLAANFPQWADSTQILAIRSCMEVP